MRDIKKGKGFNSFHFSHPSIKECTSLPWFLKLTIHDILKKNAQQKKVTSPIVVDASNFRTTLTYMTL